MDLKLYLAKITWLKDGATYIDTQLVKAKNKDTAKDKIFAYYRKNNDLKPSYVIIEDVII